MQGTTRPHSLTFVSAPLAPQQDQHQAQVLCQHQARALHQRQALLQERAAGVVAPEIVTPTRSVMLCQTNAPALVVALGAQPSLFEHSAQQKRLPCLMQCDATQLLFPSDLQHLRIFVQKASYV